MYVIICETLSSLILFPHYSYCYDCFLYLSDKMSIVICRTRLLRIPNLTNLSSPLFLIFFSLRRKVVLLCCGEISPIEMHSRLCYCYIVGKHFTFPATSAVNPILAKSSILVNHYGVRLGSYHDYILFF